MSFSNQIRKVWKLILFLFTIIFLVTLILYYKVFIDPENSKSVFYPISKEEIKLFKEGDIVLRRGYGTFSDGIAKVQNGKWNATHCAMLVINNNNWKVIHALSSSVAPFDGSQYQSFRQFLNESQPNSVIVVRFKTSSDTTKRLVNLMRYYAEHHKPFDHEFDKQDTSKFYCTELFQHCFKKTLKKDIFLGQLDSNTTGIYDLTTFQDKRYFGEIINHQRRN
jgi:hypothetical protein